MMEIKMKSRRKLVIVSLLSMAALIAALPEAVYNQSSQISRGIDYLKSIQEADGSWTVSNTSTNDTFSTTATALTALRIAESSVSTSQTNAGLFLKSKPAAVTPY